jgi:hypothetical protein
MGRASTEMREYQDEVTEALENNQFTAEQVKVMMLDAVRFMNPHELDRVLAVVGMDRLDLG